MNVSLNVFWYSNEPMSGYKFMPIFLCDTGKTIRYCTLFCFCTTDLDFPKHQKCLI